MSEPTDTLDFHPTREQYSWTFGGVPAVARVRPGTLLSLWSDDAFGGRVHSVDQRVTEAVPSDEANPQTGPFYITGAKPGDTLAIHIVSLRAARSWGISSTYPMFGGLSATHQTALLHAPLPERVWIYDLDRDRNHMRFTATDSDYSVDLSCELMLGTVGVAPARREARSTMVADRFGGNMDCTSMRPGTTCFLGVNVEGAYLSIGDGHYRQGEGEVCGTAVEGAMDSKLIVDLLPGLDTPWPRLETDTEFMSLGSARPLEDAWRIAHLDLVRWVQREHGLSELDAYQLLSQVTRSPIANAVDPNYTAVAAAAKRWFPKMTAYRQMHERLRDTAAGLAGRPGED